MRQLAAGAATLMVLFAFAGEANAATTVGSDLAATAGTSGGCGSAECTLVHRSFGAAQSPVNGIIVRWRIKVGNPSPAQPVALRVIRGTGSSTTGVGTGQAEAVPSSPGTYTYSAQLPIRVGDFIGIDCCPVGEAATYMSADVGGQTDVWNPRLADGESRDDSGGYGFELLINADVEPDADGDGFGDETQDLCPSDPTTQGLCALAPIPDTTPPQTTIEKRPKNKSKKHKAKYKFASDEPGSTFECKIDKKPFKTCTSPLKFKVKKGKHKFSVRAVDSAGNADPTVERDRFKVIG